MRKIEGVAVKQEDNCKVSDRGVLTHPHVVLGRHRPAIGPDIVNNGNCWGIELFNEKDDAPYYDHSQPLSFQSIITQFFRLSDVVGGKKSPQHNITCSLCGQFQRAILGQEISRLAHRPDNVANYVVSKSLFCRKISALNART